VRHYQPHINTHHAAQQLKLIDDTTVRVLTQHLFDLGAIKQSANI
jgi:hypothetical protein